ncbi:hypothetical protein [Klebsiella pneumoniae]|uniref:hypothetical protein n=1 Tax=Klebsiella pneumoniae TaxID=573 RepID=UPI00386017C3
MVDTGVSGISVREVEAEIPIKMDEEIPQEIKEIIEEDYKYRYMFSHPTDEGGSVSFPMGESRKAPKNYLKSYL